MTDPLRTLQKRKPSFCLKSVTETAKVETKPEVLGLMIAHMIDYYLKSDKRLPGLWKETLDGHVKQIEDRFLAFAKSKDASTEDVKLIAALVPPIKHIARAVKDESDHMVQMLKFLQYAKRAVVEFVPCLDPARNEDIVNDLKIVLTKSKYLFDNWIKPSGIGLMPANAPLLETSSVELREINQALWKIRWHNPRMVQLDTLVKKKSSSVSIPPTLDSKGVDLEQRLVAIHKLVLAKKKTQDNVIEKFRGELHSFKELVAEAVEEAA